MTASLTVPTLCVFVMVIGPAGEKQVTFAVVENDYWRSAGRTGTGAVMGSKNIKAIAFWGRRKKTFADPEVLKNFARSLAAYLDAIRTNRPPPVPGLAGLEELQFEAALRRSIAQGQYTWCPERRFYGSMHAQRFTAAARACYPLPEDVK